MSHAPAAVILNPNASDAAGEQMTSLLERRDDGVDLFVTETRDDGRNAVRDALDAGARRLVAAGGDGTVHLVANVLLDEDVAEEVSIGIVPCGTGNDLPRTLDLPADMADALDVAPTADAFDGWMDVVVRRGSLAELTGVGTKLLTGNWLDHELVEHRRAQHVRIDGPPAMLFNADGELWANGTVDATLVPGALSVAVPNAHDS